MNCENLPPHDDVGSSDMATSKLVSKVIFPVCITLRNEFISKLLCIYIIQDTSVNCGKHFVCQTGRWHCGSQPCLDTPHDTKCSLSCRWWQCHRVVHDEKAVYVWQGHLVGWLVIHDIRYGAYFCESLDCNWLSSVIYFKYAGKQRNSSSRDFKWKCFDRLFLEKDTESSTLLLPSMAFNNIVSRCPKSKKSFSPNRYSRATSTASIASK